MAKPNPPVTVKIKPAVGLAPATFTILVGGRYYARKNGPPAGPYYNGVAYLVGMPIKDAGWFASKLAAAARKDAPTMGLATALKATRMPGGHDDCMIVKLHDGRVCVALRNDWAKPGRVTSNYGVMTPTQAAAYAADLDAAKAAYWASR